MKCFIAILLLAVVAVAMAVEKTSEVEKAPQVADAGRDKRGLAYSPYSYSPYAQTPYAYSPYAYNAYNLPYAYSSPYSYPSRYHYPYYSNLHNYVY